MLTIGDQIDVVIGEVGKGQKVVLGVDAAESNSGTSAAGPRPHSTGLSAPLLAASELIHHIYIPCIASRPSQLPPEPYLTCIQFQRIESVYTFSIILQLLSSITITVAIAFTSYNYVSRTQLRDFCNCNILATVFRKFQLYYIFKIMSILFCK